MSASKSPWSYNIMHEDLSEKLFDNQAIVVTEPIADYRHCLYQSELALVQDVSNKRMLEFSTGRDCAHQALHQLGFETCPILRGPQREPLWPERVVGSISHCRDLAGAVVADKRMVDSVGLDIENIKPLNPGIARHVCTEEERHWLMQLDESQQNLALLLIFSLKEAVFKCVYQATRHALRFQQCRIIPASITDNIINTISLPKSILINQEIRSCFFISNSPVYSGVYLPRQP